MARPLSLDLRERVVDAVGKGMSCRQAAARFGVSASSAIRWGAQVRAGVALAPRNQGGDRRSQRIETEAAFILGAVAQRPDMTLAELKEKLRTRHERRDRNALALLPASPHHAEKKIAHAAEQQRPDVKDARETWFERQLDLDPEKLIFIDEQSPISGMHSRTSSIPSRPMNAETISPPRDTMHSDRKML